MVSGHSLSPVLARAFLLDCGGCLIDWGMNRMNDRSQGEGNSMSFSPRDVLKVFPVEGEETEPTLNGLGGQPHSGNQEAHGFR